MSTARRATVSLLMIVRNEEHNLADCLTPVADLFDEIVIVDTGSQDSTREIAARFTPHVLDFPWCDDFSAARNHGLKHSSGDWVFWLDADDRLTPGNVEKLRKLLATLDDQPRVYMIDTISQPADPSEPAWTVTHPRLFRRQAELAWQGRAHEQLRPEPALLGFELVPTDIDITHIGYEDAAQCQRKWQRQLRLLRMDYTVNPEDPSTLFHLGMAYACIGKCNESRKFFGQLLRQRSGPLEYKRRVYSSLVSLTLVDGQYDEGLRVAQEGLSYFPEDEQLLFESARVLYGLSHYAAAAEALRKVMAHQERQPLYCGGHSDLKRRLAPRVLGDVLRMQQAYVEGEATLRTVIAEFPTDTQAWYNLGLIFLDSGNDAGLREVTGKLASCPGGRLFANLLQIVWRLRHDQLQGLDALLDEAVAAAPQLLVPRLLRAEWLSRTAAPYEAQMQAMRDILRIQPTNQEAARWLDYLAALQQRAKAPTAYDGCTSVVLMPGVVVS